MDTQISIINNKKISYRIINEAFRNPLKPVLVFLHEGLGSMAQWRDFPARLSTETGCAAMLYDRYGYGLSEAFDGIRNSEYMPDEAFDFLPQLLEKAGITEKIILVGHSDGGTIALLFASRFPDKVTAVITEADHVISEDITLNGVRQITAEYESGNLKKLLSKFHPGKTDAMFYSWSKFWLQKAQANWHIKDALPAITAPVLAIQGKDDRYGSVKQLTVKLELIGGQTEVLYIPACGHVPHFEAMEPVLGKMKAFILRLIKMPF